VRGMVAPAQEDDSTPQSVVLQIFSDEELGGDDGDCCAGHRESQSAQSTPSCLSAGGTRSCGACSVATDCGDSVDEVNLEESPSRRSGAEAVLDLASCHYSSEETISPYVSPLNSPVRSGSRESSAPDRGLASSFAAPSRDFSVHVERDSPAEELGLEISQDPAADALRIGRIKAGPVRRWGLKHPERRARIGDLIVAVDGQEGAGQELVEQIRGSPSMRLTIRRFNEFDVCVRAEGKLGIDVTFTKNSMQVISLADDGTIEEWNAAAGWEAKVRLGDHIVEVNGLRSNSDELLEALKNSRRPMQLVFQRCGGLPMDRDPPDVEDSLPVDAWEARDLRAAALARRQRIPASRRLPEARSEVCRRAARHRMGLAAGLLGPAEGTTSNTGEMEDDTSSRREYFAVQVW